MENRPGICSRCGFENTGANKFCIQCGAPLDTESTVTQQSSSQSSQQNTQQDTQQNAQQNIQQDDTAYPAPSDNVSAPPPAQPPAAADAKRIRRLTVIAIALGVVILILAGILVFALINRGGKDTSDNNAVSNETVTEEAATESAKKTPKPTSKPTAGPTSAPSSSSDDGDFPIGSVSDTTYENKALGFGIKLDGCTIMPREQTNSVYNASISYISDSMSDDELKKALKNTDNFMDMFATGKDGRSNVNIMISKNSGFSEANEKSFLELVNTSAKQYYENMGVDIYSTSITDVSISGKTKTAVVMDCNMFTSDCTIVQLIFANRDYMAIVTVTAPLKSDALEYCKKIYTL